MVRKRAMTALSNLKWRCSGMIPIQKIFIPMSTISRRAKAEPMSPVFHRSHPRAQSVHQEPQSAQRRTRSLSPAMICAKDSPRSSLSKCPILNSKGKRSSGSAIAKSARSCSRLSAKSSRPFLEENPAIATHHRRKSDFRCASARSGEESARTDAA